LGLSLWLGVGGWALVALPLLLGWRRTGDVARQAGLVEALAPELRGRLLTAVERADGPRGGESPALLGLVARRAVAAIRELGPERVHPGGRLRRALIAAVALLAVGLLGTALAP